MTRGGLTWYRSLADESFGTCDLSQAFVDQMTEPNRCWFAERLAIDWTLFEETWHWFLAEGPFGDQAKDGLWMRVRVTSLTYREDSGQCPARHWGCWG
jgi:hypothetical protein